MEVSGKIKVINANLQVSASYVKSEMVITTDEQFPQHIMIEFGGQKADLVDPYKVGENVKVSINLRGREWINPQGEAKYFNSIQGWRIEKLKDGAPAAAAPQTATPAAQQTFEPSSNFNEEDDNDLPF